MYGINLSPNCEGYKSGGNVSETNTCSINLYLYGIS